MNSLREQYLPLCGYFVNVRNVKTRGVAVLEIEIPSEQVDAALKMVGWPVPGSEPYVVVCPLTKSEAEPVVKEKPLSSRAYLTIQQAAFQDWLEREMPDMWDMTAADNPGGLPATTADTMVKKYCGMQSKSELDAPGSSRDRWNVLYGRYYNDTHLPEQTG